MGGNPTIKAKIRTNLLVYIFRSFSVHLHTDNDNLKYVVFVTVVEKTIGIMRVLQLY